MLIATAFVLSAFVGIVPAAQAAANALNVSDILKAFDAQGIPLSDGTRAHTDLLAMNPNTLVTAILKLPADPVAVVKSQMPDMQLSTAQKDAIKAELKARQDALIPTIESLGGRVVAQYQVAYNGIAIQIPRSKLAGLAQLNAVVSVSPVQAFSPAHTTTLPFLGVPQVWGGVPGFRGEGMKIAIIDTGIDYTHANFGGPGTVAAFETAVANSSLPADPSMFGPNAPKVKGGTDLVGDAYTGLNTEMPDPNPLDCNGHGSHTAGTAAGFGVTSAGATYTGPYDASTFSGSFNVGPGVAPLADLYSVRVFGCSGFTSSQNVVTAIEWAVDHGMDVISMSLGSDFGTTADVSVEASNNAALAGTIVVAAAGNAGPSPYIVSSPGIASRAISVAADDATASFPGATIALRTGTTLTTINANGISPLPTAALKIAVLRNADGTPSLGCDPAEYTNFPGGVAGMLVVTQRGTCARGARQLLVGGTAGPEQRAEAGHRRAGRLRPVDPDRLGYPGRPVLRDVHGDPARGGHRGPRPRGASLLDRRRGEGRDPEHGQLRPGQRVPGPARRHGRRPADPGHRDERDRLLQSRRRQPEPRLPGARPGLLPRGDAVDHEQGYAPGTVRPDCREYARERAEHGHVQHRFRAREARQDGLGRRHGECTRRHGRRQHADIREPAGLPER